MSFRVIFIAVTLAVSLAMSYAQTTWVTGGDEETTVWSTHSQTTLTPDPCTSNPCQNNGHCMVDGGQIMCHCADGWTGDYCDQKSSANNLISWSPSLLLLAAGLVLRHLF